MNATPILASIICICSVILAAPAAAEWQGTTVTEAGQTIVRNPETAAGTYTIELEEAWRRGDADDDMFFGMPTQVVESPGGEVYVLDAQVSEIHVFTRDGEFLRTIGREGEGPGEFRGANTMYFGPGGVLGVMSIFPAKIVQIMPDGTPAGNFPLPREEGGGFQLAFKARANDQRIVVCGGRQSRESNTQLNYLEAYDKDGKVLATYHHWEEHTQYGGMKFDEKVWGNATRQWSMARDGRVAGALSFDDYRIHVWNPDGSLVHIIERPDYPPVERTSEEKKRFQTIYDGLTRWSPNSTFQISDTHRAIMQVYYQPDGSLWVLSGRGQWRRPDGAFAVFDIYDREGRFMSQVTLVGEGSPTEDGVFFSDERLYRVSDLTSAFMAQIGGGEAEPDEDAEPLQLVAYPLDTSQLGMGR